MNWIDIVIIIIFTLYVYEDSHRGFLRLFADLVSLIVAFVIALVLYLPLVNFLAYFKIVFVNIESICFLSIWLILQFVFFTLSKIVSRQTSETVKKSKINRYLAFIPAIVKGVFLIIVMTILTLYVPLSQTGKNVFKKSLIIGVTLGWASDFEAKLENIFTGPSTNNSVSNQTKNYVNDETVDLRFSTTNMTIDETAEKIIFDKVNEERQKVGLNPLVSDTLIRNVARAHSRDMLANGYFSHTSQNGEVLLDRLVNAKVSFSTAAENIATAPTAELVHLGLMNSEKHKKNILDPSFTRVGIGVMDAGQYGLMVTQDFAN